MSDLLVGAGFNPLRGQTKYIRQSRRMICAAPPVQKSRETVAVGVRKSHLHVNKNGMMLNRRCK